MIENYCEGSDIGCLFEVDVKYPEQLHKLHNDLPILPERWKIKKFKKLLDNLYNTKMCVFITYWSILSPTDFLLSPLSQNDSH